MEKMKQIKIKCLYNCFANTYNKMKEMKNVKNKILKNILKHVYFWGNVLANISRR